MKTNIYDGDKIKKPADPTLSENTFVKWVNQFGEDIDFDKVYNADDIKAQAIAIDLIAVWDNPITPSITITDTMFNFDNVKDIEYTGNEYKPKVTSDTLKENIDYTITYSQLARSTDFSNVGQYQISITGKGVYNGTITKTYEITPITNVKDMVIKIADQIFTGGEIKPNLNITDGVTSLVEGVDYTITYSNNVSIGKGTVTIKGIGKYSGTTTVEFNIIKNTNTGSPGTAAPDSNNNNNNNSNNNTYIPANNYTWHSIKTLPNIYIEEFKNVVVNQLLNLSRINMSIFEVDFGNFSGWYYDDKYTNPIVDNQLTNLVLTSEIINGGIYPKFINKNEPPILNSDENQENTESDNSISPVPLTTETLLARLF